MNYLRKHSRQGVCFYAKQKQTRTNVSKSSVPAERFGEVSKLSYPLEPTATKSAHAVVHSETFLHVYVFTVSDILPA